MIVHALFNVTNNLKTIIQIFFYQLSVCGGLKLFVNLNGIKTPY